MGPVRGRVRPAVWLSIGVVAGLVGATLLVWYGVRKTDRSPVATRKQPDVVIISVDTLRRDHLSVYGYDRPTDPNLSRMASDAIVFDNAIAAHTNTGPSHASMMTGQYPSSHGVLRNRYRLKAGVTTLAELLKRQGYQTAAVVSSVMLSNRLTGLGKGFDVYLECAAGVSDRQAAETWRVVGRQLARLDPDRPVFLFVHFFDPHYPYRAPASFSKLFLPPGKTGFRFPENAALARLRGGGAREGELEEYVARYDGEIRYADHYVGKFLDRLRVMGRYDGAIIVALSDHGETLDERPFVFDHGARAYEEQIRIPLIMHLPGAACGGMRTSVAAHHVDLVPTVLDALALPIPETVQGVSLLRESGGEGGQTEGARLAECYSRAPRGEGHEARRGPMDRLLVSFARPDARRVPQIAAPVVDRGLVVSLRVWPWKTVSYPVAGGRYEELFLLTEDPGERHNLVDERPSRARAMASALEPWVQAVDNATGPGPVPVSGEDASLLKTLGYLP